MGRFLTEYEGWEERSVYISFYNCTIDPRSINRSPPSNRLYIPYQSLIPLIRFQILEHIHLPLLIELDGADRHKGVYVIGATNRPDVMDPAFLRPGRFGKLLSVPLPNEDERGMILKALARNKPVAADVDLIAFGRSEACANLSGADLSALMNEAAMAAEDEGFVKLEAGHESQNTINAIHFEQGLTRISPSVSNEQKQYYHCLSKSFKPT